MIDISDALIAKDAEIDRLRTALERTRLHANEIIEECARMAESSTYMSGAAIATAIRALKEKP